MAHFQSEWMLPTNLEKLGLLAIPEIEAALPKVHGEAAFRLPRLLHALVLRETECFFKTIRNLCARRRNPTPQTH